jgi:hypothetical protein
MSEMVERVAQAMQRASRTDALVNSYAIFLARVAIEAMREPTASMLIGARDWSLKKNGQGVGDDQATGCWQAMLDAVLTEDAP